MSLKKFLKRGVKEFSTSHSGQVVMEYFILFCLLTALVLVTTSYFFARTQATTTNFMRASLDAMEQKNLPH